MTFAEIIGQENAKQLLINAIKNEQLSHAYILNGEDGSGKMMLAEAFAATLMCETSNEDACMQCATCHKTINRNNPDIIYIQHEKPDTISVDDIRKQVNADIVLKPYNSKYKIYIIDEAEKMNTSAQNAILKTIEEPPAYAIIILLTTNANMLLQTILSRCVQINMKPIEDSLIRNKLLNDYRIVDYQADIVLAFAQGNIGKAIDLISSEEFTEQKKTVIGLVKKISRMDSYEISQAVKEIGQHRGEIRDFIDLITLWYRDVLLYKSTLNESQLIYKDDIYSIREDAEEISYKGLNNIFAALNDARARLVSNVNFDLMVECLLTAIKENSK